MTVGPCKDCHRRTMSVSGRTPGLRRRLAMTGIQLGYLDGHDELICEDCLVLWLPANVTSHRSDP